MFYWVQTGLLGEIGCYRSATAARLERDVSVICRTNRGLEVGQVVTPDQRPASAEIAGTVMRRMTPDDRLIVERMERYKNRAFEACCTLLHELSIPATLVDVEQLFDGQSVYFYFLGSVPESIDQITPQLMEIYDAKIRFRQFAEKLALGCGPGCGTTASKCGENGACTSCSLATGCRTDASSR